RGRGGACSSSSEFHLYAKCRPPTVMFFLQNPLAHTLVVSQERVVEIHSLDIRTNVPGDRLRHRDVQLAIAIVITVERVGGADDVDVRAVEIHRNTTRETTLFICHRQVAHVARLAWERRARVTGDRCR